MTNVPGFIPKPYPIVIFPGTFVIILQKVAFFFRIVNIFFKKKVVPSSLFGVKQNRNGHILFSAMLQHTFRQTFTSGFLLTDYCLNLKHWLRNLFWMWLKNLFVRSPLVLSRCCCCWTCCCYFCCCFCCMYLTMYLYGGAERPPITT